MVEYTSMSVEIQKYNGVNPDTHSDSWKMLRMVHPEKITGILIYESPIMKGAHYLLAENSQDDTTMRIGYTAKDNVIKVIGRGGAGHRLINPFMVHLQYEITEIDKHVYLGVKLEENKPIIPLRLTLV